MVRCVTLTALCACLMQAQTPTFFARADYLGSSFNSAIGDFNGDGIPDVLLDYGQLYLGNGDGTFTRGPLRNPFICTDFGFAVGDLNGDGKLDAVGICSTGAIQIAFGNGDGTFQAGQVISNAGGYSITIADVNGDGLPDILISSTGLLVFVNQGAGVFGPYTTLLPGSNVSTTAVGDVNGDGIADIVAGTGAGAQVLLGTGGGNFQTGQSIALPSPAGSLVLADMNGDGKLDLVAAGFAFGTEVSVLIGDGYGTFSPHSTVQDPNGAYAALVGDMNGDGHPDLVIHQNGEYTVAVAFNRGDATFTQPVPFAAEIEVSSITIGPLRKPGLIDIVVNGRFSGFTSVLLNEGNGTFEDGILVPMSTPPTQFAAGDFNGDGLTDFAVLTSAGVSIYQNSGEGYGPFTVTATYALTSPNFIVTTDFNKDGHPDLAVSLAAGGIAILLGQGGGQFAAPVIVPSGAASMIALGDFNEDGKVDIVATSNQIFFGNGDGTFAAPQPLFSLGSFFTNNPLAWIAPIHANLKRNRYLDLAVITNYSLSYSHFWVLVNNGKGSFHFATTKLFEVATGSEMAVADFNGDGLPDLLFSGGGFPGLALGNGDGTFTGQPGLGCGICGLLGNSLVTWDFNGDGKVDFAVNTGQNINVFLGNGDGTFVNPLSALGTDPGTGFFEYVDLRRTSAGPLFAFVTAASDGLGIALQLTK
jgi:hypothetical protein